MRRVAFLAFALSCSTPGEMPPAKAPRFPGFIPVGIYVAAERLADAWEVAEPVHLGRPALETYVRDLEDMARHGMNVVAIENTSGIPTGTLVKMVREGHERGIRTWASENGLPPDAELEAWSAARHAVFRDEPGLLAWSPWDEPLAEQMERWLRVKAVFERNDPVHPVLAVTHGGPKGFERHAKAQGVDFYPVMVDRSEPLAVGPLVRRYVEAAGATPVWFVQQAFRGEGRRLPTPAESRLMTFVAIAHGARGIFHFIYDHVTDPINAPTELWEEIGEMSWRLAAVGPVLLESSPVDPAAWATLSCTTGSASLAVLASPGGALVLVTNTSATEPAVATLQTLQGRPARRTFTLAPGDGEFHAIGDGVAAAVARATERRDQARKAVEARHKPWEPLTRARDEAARLYARIRGAKPLRNRYWGIASRYLELEAAHRAGEPGLEARVRELRNEIEELSRKLPD